MQPLKRILNQFRVCLCPIFGGCEVYVHALGVHVCVHAFPSITRCYDREGDEKPDLFLSVNC